MRYISRKILLLYTIGTLIGPSVISLNIGYMHLSMNRILNVVMLFLCAAYTFSVAETKNISRWTLHSNNNTYTILFFIFWLLYAILSLTWAADVLSWTRNFYFLLCGVIVIVYYSFFVTSIDDIRKFLLLLTFFSVIHGIIGVYEMCTGNYMFRIADINIYAAEHLPVSSWYNVNSFALAMLIGLCSSIGVFFSTEKKLFKYLSLCAMCFFAVMCFASRSRGIIFGVLLAVFCSGIFCRRFRKYIIISAIALFIIALCAYLLLIFTGELNFHYDSVFKLTFDRKDSSDSIRLNLIKNGLSLLIDHLFMGVSLGNIEYYMLNYQIYDTAGMVNMHNWWMEILTGSGIFVFIGYCIFYYKIIRRMIILSNKYDKRRASISFAFVVFLWAFVIASVTESSIMGHDIVWTYFAIIIAFERVSYIKRCR